MSKNPTEQSTMEELDLPLERDGFVRDMLRELSGVLEEVVGLDHATGFISVVGQRIGGRIGRSYRAALGAERLSPSQVGSVLVDLKRRIQGDFEVVEQDEEKIVLTATACPFGDKVHGRSSMCMMTSNVFGTIVADELGYARVELEQTIARGDGGCRVVVCLQEAGAEASLTAREYYRNEEE